MKQPRRLLKFQCNKENTIIQYTYQTAVSYLQNVNCIDQEVSQSKADIYLMLLTKGRRNPFQKLSLSLYVFLSL